jgi:CBS domain-containing protein
MKGTTHLLILILDDLAKLPALLAAWRKIGVGTTLVNSQGGYRVGNWLDRLGLGGLSRLIEQNTRVHQQRLLMSLIAGDELLEQAIAEADRVVGGFERPNTGILFSIPIGRALGLNKKRAAHGQEPQAEDIGRLAEINVSTSVSEIIHVLDLEPCLVNRDDPVEDVVRKLVDQPNIQVVGVVTEEGHLVGVIDTVSLSESLFSAVFPETYLAELHDVDQVFEYVKKPHGGRTAEDVMQEPPYVFLDNTLLEAFQVLKARKLQGTPVVDRNYNVVGQINMLVLMAITFLEQDAQEEAGTE